MKKRELIYFGFTCFSLCAFVIILIYLLMFMAIAEDLRDKVIIMEHEKVELNQEITELQWELDQVDKMICNNDMLDYEVK